MALKVVGAGFGRTGTLSLKHALERLGFGPCYHMMEVFPRPDHVALWHRLAFGNSMDLDLIFRDFRATVDWPAPAGAPEVVRLQNEMGRKAILAETFDNRFEDKAHVIEVFKRHSQEVSDTIDPARLLVFDVREGWAPLCRFLEVPVPSEPFPRLNDTATTQAMIQLMRE